MPTILIIGGYGNTGYYVAELLLTQLSIAQKIEALRRHQDAFVERGMTVITDAGFHPGLPGAPASDSGR